MITLSRGELKTGIEVAKMREEDYSQKGNQMTEITLKGETYRIRRLDPRNLVIEQLKGKGSPTWGIIGYYGRLSDLSIGLLNRVVDVPEADTLIDQVAALRVELRQVAEAIEMQLREVVA